MATEVGKLYYDLGVDDSSLERGLDKGDRAVNDFGKKGAGVFRDFANSASESFGRISDGITSFARKATVALAASSFGVASFVKDASELQSVRASFESMTGSASEAERVLRQLNKFSFQTAFSTKEINAAARTLLGAGLNVDDLGKRMKQIGDVAGATGADLGRLTLPLSQALARGKLQTQDFYQILDSGAGSLGKALREKLAQQGMGDFMKAMEQGKVTTDILFQTLEEATQQGGFAFEGAIKQAQTFNGRMSNLKETVLGVGLELLGVDKATGRIDPDGVFAKMSKAVEDATKWLSENKDTILAVANTIKDNLVPAISGLAAAYTTAKVAAILFSIAAMTGPQLIGVAIVALVAGLVYLYMRFEWFRNAVNGVFNFIKENWQLMLIGMTAGLGLIVVGIINHWEKIKSVFTSAYNFIKENWQLLLIFLTMGFGAIVVGIINHWDKIKNAASVVKNVIVSAFQWAWDRVTSIWNGITGFFGGIWDGIKNGLSGAMDGVKNIVKSTVNWMIDKVNWIIKKVNDTAGKVPGVPTIGEIPKLAKGGIVTRPTIALIGEAGPEAVVPLSKANNPQGIGMGGNITINLSGIMTESREGTRQVARTLVSALNEQLRAKGMEEIVI